MLYKKAVSEPGENQENQKKIRSKEKFVKFDVSCLNLIIPT